MTHKCVCCGSSTADKLVIRNLDTDGSHGHVDAGASQEEIERFTQRFYALIDRGEQVSKAWECKPCRTAISLAIEEELRWMAEQRGEWERD